MTSLPFHEPVDRDEFMEVLNGRKDIHSLTGPEGRDGTVMKISFICACHGLINANIIDTGLPIPANGKYTEETIGPIFSRTPKNRPALARMVTNTVPLYTSKIVYKKPDPIIELQCAKIDVREMNVTLSTTNTCLGAPIYRPSKTAIIKQKFVNEIMEDLTSSCPTNTLLETIGDFGETFRITHKDYKASRRASAARKVQRLFTKKSRKSPPFGKSSKTRLMKYEKEKVDWLMNKTYGVVTCDVATIATPIPPEGEVEIVPTECDAHKLIMIVTRYTPGGCESKKYTLLASDYELDELGEIYEDFPESIGDFIHHSFEKVTADLIMGREHNYPLVRLSLYNLIILGKKIIEQINGPDAVKTVPIDIYELSCNTFGPFQNIKRPLTERELLILRMFDDYARLKNISYGGKSRKHKRKFV